MPILESPPPLLLRHGASSDAGASLLARSRDAVEAIDERQDVRQVNGGSRTSRPRSCRWSHTEFTARIMSVPPRMSGPPESPKQSPPLPWAGFAVSLMNSPLADVVALNQFAWCEEAAEGEDLGSAGRRRERIPARRSPRCPRTCASRAYRPDRASAASRTRQGCSAPRAQSPRRRESRNPEALDHSRCTSPGAS